MAREQWEEVAFQVFEGEDGAIRSGYYPTGEGLVDGNIAVDFTFGNVPLQPNDDRDSVLSVGDSHKIALVDWNAYPAKDGPTAGSRNYVVTAAEYLGSNVYEYTSQNDLVVGDRVFVSNAGPYSFPPALEVIYADKLKFQVDTELEGIEKVTGLYGRVDVVDEPWNGHTLSEEGLVFRWPAMGWSYGTENEGTKLEEFQNFFVSVGVDPEKLKDFTFSGGDHEWDDENGEPNWDGNVFYFYIPAEEQIGQTAQGVAIYGSDVEGEVIWGGHNFGDTVYVNDDPEAYAIAVISNDPRKDTQDWWFD